MWSGVDWQVSIGFRALRLDGIQRWARELEFELETRASCYSVMKEGGKGEISWEKENNAGPSHG